MCAEKKADFCGHKVVSYELLHNMFSFVIRKSKNTHSIVWHDCFI